MERKTVGALLKEKVGSAADLTEGDWLRLLGARRIELVEQFSTVTFSTLGSQKILRGDRYFSERNGHHAANTDNLASEAQRALLSEKGLYHCIRRLQGSLDTRVWLAQDESQPLYSGTYLLWGLSARGFWQIVNIHFIEGWVERPAHVFEYAKGVEVKDAVDISAIVALGVTPRQIMKDLTGDWQRLVLRREELYKQAQEAYTRMSNEDKLLEGGLDVFDRALRTAEGR